MSTPPATNGRSTDGRQPPSAGAAPPHSIEAEQSVLGAMLLSDRTHYAFVIEEGLKVEDFAQQKIDATVNELKEEREAVRKLGLVP